MKRLIILCGMLSLICVLLAMSLSQAQQTKQVYLAASIQPMALLLRALVPEDRQVICLVPAGQSPHTFSPRPSIVDQASDALLLLSVAESLDAWSQRIPVAHHVELIKMLPSEQLIKSMPHEGHDHGTIDPHIWLDPERMAHVIPSLVEVLVTADRIHEQHYRLRGQALKKEFLAIAKQMQERGTALQEKSIIQFHPSMAYLLDHLGMHDAGVVNVHVGSNPTPRYVENLITEARQKSCIAVCSEPQLPRRAAQHIADQMQLPLCIIDPLGSHAANLDALWNNNLDALLKALDDR